ncbi:MAG TPA: AMP-binding protein [Acidimicrobiia bacterium]|nr:AMP-binding protein [Acidimicrobiia bacterium]
MPTSDAPATLPAMLVRHADSRARDVALRAKRFGRWEEMTWADYERRATRIGLGLRELGVGTGDRVAVLSDNRPEWLFVDLGTQGIGGVTLGVYPTSSESEVAHVLGNSVSKIVVVEDEEQLDKTLLVRDQLPHLEKIVVIDTRGIRSLEDPATMSLDELEALGDQRFQRLPREWRDSVASLPGGPDVAIIVYTSGAAGPPQGVMLSHANLIAAAETAVSFYNARRDEEILSYLPLCHVAERLVSVITAVRAGYVVNFGEGGESFLNDLREVQPTFFLGVPRVWERLAAGVQFRIANASRIKRWNYNIWQRRGAKVAGARMRGKRRGRLSELFGWLFLGRSLRRKLGMSRIRVALSGAAPIAPDVLAYMWSLGVPVREVYGQTENTALATSTPADAVRIGKVGRPLPGVDVRIADDGEILVRGPGNFLGYLGDEEATERAYNDGWLRSGDLGELDDDGFLAITGRTKDIVMTAAGVNISPAKLENLLKFSPFVRDAMVVGDRRPHLAALVGIDLGMVSVWAQQQNLQFTTQRDLVEKPEVRRLVESAVNEVNRQVDDEEQIQGFELLPVDLEETGALTATQKVRRGMAAAQFSDLIERMYAA